MIIFKTAQQLNNHLNTLRQKQLKIGFVPTMGALHEGHLSLIQNSKTATDITVCSIFVNPTQFNDAADFAKYPITIENDVLLLEQSKTDILFLPDVKEIYPNGTQPQHHYNLGYLEEILEGKYRHGHFQGVCQVVDRLLSIVNPHVLFLGRKDYQQCLVLKKMMETQYPTASIVFCDTKRESSGLAMSSRNMRLNEVQKKQAETIYQSLLFVKDAILKQPITQLQQQITENLTNAGFEKIDYISVCDADTLMPVTDTDKHTKPLVALIAAFMGDVRLIDNMALS